MMWKVIAGETNPALQAIEEIYTAIHDLEDKLRKGETHDIHSFYEFLLNRSGIISDSVMNFPNKLLAQKIKGFLSQFLYEARQIVKLLKDGSSHASTPVRQMFSTLKKRATQIQELLEKSHAEIKG